MASQRLFVAIDLPTAVTDLLTSMNPQLPGMRWLRPNQIHLTVSFLGNVGPLAEETLRERLAAIRFVPFFM
ncbi:MAG: RNA 2',3'-cyclic phosphodiesterase, partial [Verrucomicrobiota bacterium]|nr:RNA 2',3'-cyclic phosphodiesterase [Verrucomicrobiota bacterium]